MANVPTLSAVCGPDALMAIEGALTTAWTVNPVVPEPIRSQVQMAVAEVASNIVEHAGRGQPATVQMWLRVLSCHVEVDFTDDGVEAVVDLEAVCMPDPFAERGRGLAIAKAVLAQLSYRRSDLGNHWTLISRSFR